MTATTMRWLILPDIHDKLRRATQIVEREPHDRLLLMGDFFDDFRTGVTDAADTANQVKRWLNSPNTACLLGNHDMSYGWCRQNRRLLCPGYDAAKWIAVNATVTTRDWQKFKLHAWLEGDRGGMAGEPRRGASGLAGGRRAGQVQGGHRPGLRRRLDLP
jgi:predicted MPP superfamily phosphohydrolase